MLTAYALCLALSIVHGPQGSSNLSEERIKFACEQMPHVLEASYKYNINPYTLTAMIFVESRWSSTAVSKAGACGLTQVLPKYVAQTCKELKDPKISIHVGAHSLNKWIVKRKKKNEKLALACYNAGNKCDSSKTGRSYSNKIRKLAKKYNRWVMKNSEINYFHTERIYAHQENYCQ